MPANTPLLSVIILNHNGQELLKIALPSLYWQTFKDFEIIVVDNGSTDGSEEFIKLNYPGVRIIRNSVNSFTKGNNLGIKSALGEFIFILNNDVELHVKCLEALAKSCNDARNNIGMWATKILNFNHRDVIDNTGLILYADGISRGRGRLEKDTGQYDHITEVLMPSGCAGLYRKKMLDQIGLFDEDFVFYGEDSDLGFRARLAGWQCDFVPGAKIYHMYSATLGKHSPQKAYQIERNRLWLLVKSFPLKMLCQSPYFTFKRYFWQVYGLIKGKGAASQYSHKYSKLSLLGVLIKAWFMALLKLPAMLAKRRSLKKIKKISDAEVKNLLSKFYLSAREISLKDY